MNLTVLGSWLTNLLVMILIRLAMATIPGLSTEASWTLTNLIYNVVGIFGAGTFGDGVERLA